ncbi:hypothetical protein A2U01_0024741 [Trifolium medium]|uniref:Uncharacterized protein n=1 Tax=Trifolium medium TaxID=97028 RepID=A0A392NV54_9FABA|nr:hypothetical protein [Trifolium medium]
MHAADSKVSPRRVQPSVFNHGQGRVTLSPAKRKMARGPTFSPASLLKNPYEEYLKKLHPQQNLLKENLLLIKD